jgi:CRISPR-associated protein (TIGR02710 family)
MTTILFCTVGGSHQPIVTAIRELEPSHVVFFCSEDDVATGRKGSYVQVLGKGNCIKGDPRDERPTLPCIPAQAGLKTSQVRVEKVPADDLDAASAHMGAVIARTVAEFPHARAVADYTGGTKTMTAALVVAALGAAHVDLQLVTGTRADLIKVRPGSERSVMATVEGLRLARAMDLHLAAWATHGYGVAARGLAALAAPRNNDLRGKLNRARELSRAFDAWDRFDHGLALQGMEDYSRVVAPRLSAHYGALRILAGRESPQREGLRIWDLWLNALRRAENARYDDAVARVYRMLEWTAQWVLRTRAGLDTAALPPDKVEPGIATMGRDGKLKAGLHAAWQLVERHTDGPSARFIAEHRDRLLDQLSARNESILAHGFKPLDESRWNGLRAWTEAAFLPGLRAELAAAGQTEVFPQLPSSYLWYETE